MGGGLLLVYQGRKAMATKLDVQNVLADIITAIMYPNGSSDNCSIANFNVMIYPGWPTPDRLDKDMATGELIHVSIHPRPGEGRDSTRNTPYSLIVSIGQDTGESIKVVGLREQAFQITIWAPDPISRDAAERLIEAYLSDTYRITMPDNTFASMVFKSSTTDDNTQKAGFYRSMLVLDIEYAITIQNTDYVIKESIINIQSQRTSL
jgi:hypothetical protein